VALLIEAMKKEHKQVQKNLSMMNTMQTTLEEHGRKIASLEEENIQLKKENADIKIRLNRLEKAILQMKH
jgi:cell shape-determining protein MreC